MEAIVRADVFAHELPDRMLACRELGHVWQPYRVDPVIERRKVRGYERVMKCKQCKTERVQLLDSRGAVMRNGYRYSTGYLADHVEKGFTRDTFRLESVTRWLDRHPPAEAEDEEHDDRKAS